MSEEALEWEESAETTLRTRLDRKACGCMMDEFSCRQHPDPSGEICLCLCHAASSDEVTGAETPAARRSLQ